MSEATEAAQHVGPSSLRDCRASYSIQLESGNTVRCARTRGAVPSARSPLNPPLFPPASGCAGPPCSLFTSSHRPRPGRVGWPRCSQGPRLLSRREDTHARRLTTQPFGSPSRGQLASGERANRDPLVIPGGHGAGCHCICSAARLRLTAPLPHDCWRRGCKGCILRQIQRLGKVGKRSGLGVDEPIGRQKDSKRLYLAIDEACSHLNVKRFRLLVGIYDGADGEFLGSSISPPIRVLANNDVPGGAARMQLRIFVRVGPGIDLPPRQHLPISCASATAASHPDAVHVRGSRCRATGRAGPWSGCQRAPRTKSSVYPVLLPGRVFGYHKHRGAGRRSVPSRPTCVAALPAASARVRGQTRLLA